MCAKRGAILAVFNSARTFAQVQVGLEEAGFYTKDCLVFRRHSGIPKGLNFKKKLQKLGKPTANYGTDGIAVFGMNGKQFASCKSP